ncbi:MAG: hypothetical protein LBB88_11685 [Planctomycetaceae bacterium]|nr:hypothetical protein [Planctomycetaceae bacterium]
MNRDYFFGGGRRYAISKKINFNIKFNDEKYEEKTIVFSFSLVFSDIVLHGGAHRSARCNPCREIISMAASQVESSIAAG